MKAIKRVKGNAYSGSHGALWEVIPTMDYLFIKLNKHATEVEANPDLFTDHYGHYLNHGFVKLLEYHTKIDSSRFYAASVALHPYRRFHYFDDTWRSKDSRRAITKAKSQTRSLFSYHLLQQTTESARNERSPSSPSAGSEGSDEDWQATFSDLSAVTNNDQRAREGQ